MFSLTALIIVAVVTVIAGCAIGALLSRTLSPQEQKTRTLETKLQEAEQQLTQYQQEVTEHFAETSKLVGNLTQSYRDIHQHLAGNALKLANVDISRQLLSNSVDAGEQSIDDAPIGEEGFQPPRDWAPKTPGQEGTLSESYGLKETEEYEKPTH